MLSIILLSAIVALVASNSEPQKEIMLFTSVDKNKDGNLDQKELEGIFLSFDANTDKQITLGEFENDWVKKYILGPKSEADALFAAADHNKDNKITDADLPSIFGYFDMNGDGKVDENEFLTQWGDLTLLPVTGN